MADKKPSAFTTETAPVGPDLVYSRKAAGGAGSEREQTIANLSKGLSAGSIPNTPAGDVAATDIQAAVDELDLDKQPDLDGLSLTDLGTPAATDRVLVQDADDSNILKYAQASTLGAGGGEPFQFQAVREVTSTGNIVSTDVGDLVSASGTFTLTLVETSFTVGQFVGVVNKGTGVITVSAGTNGINRAGTDSLVLQQDEMVIVTYAAGVDPFWRAEIPGSVSGTAAQMLVVDSGNDPAFVTLTGALAVTDTGVTTVEGVTFDIQFSIDITDGNGDYVIHDDSIFGYEIDSINACLLDVATSTATITVKINTTAVTGISVSATTTKQTTADPSTAASTVVATDEVSITVASVANAPTRLTGVLHCSRTLT